MMRSSSPSTDGCRPYRARVSCVDFTWACARVARFSPGYNISGLQPSESAYDLSHLGKVFDEVPDKVSDKAFQARGLLSVCVCEIPSRRDDSR
jgi:hypothetical protein